MRLFVAINLPPDLRAAVWTATGALREAGLPVRWVGAAQLHVTMQFLGEVSNERSAQTVAAVEHAARESRILELSVQGFGAFPSLRNPRVVWIGIQDAPDLTDLHGRLDRKLAEAGYDREERRFHPHVTLGRVKRGAHGSELRELESLAGSVALCETFTAETVDLMRSHLGPGGARYSVLSAAPLG